VSWSLHNLQNDKLTFGYDRPAYLEDQAKIFEEWIYTAQVVYLESSQCTKS